MYRVVILGVLYIFCVLLGDFFLYSVFYSEYIVCDAQKNNLKSKIFNFFMLLSKVCIISDRRIAALKPLLHLIFVGYLLKYS